jgi:hypothetical protein
MALDPEPNKFKGAKVKQHVPKGKWASHSSKNAIDFEQFLWDNASAEFYNELKRAINNR